MAGRNTIRKIGFILFLTCLVTTGLIVFIQRVDTLDMPRDSNFATEAFSEQADGTESNILSFVARAIRETKQKGRLDKEFQEALIDRALKEPSTRKQLMEGAANIYGGFLERNHLDADREAALITLWARGSMRNIIQVMTSVFDTPEQRKSRLTGASEADDQYNETVKKLLNEDQVEALQKWEDQLAFRSTVKEAIASVENGEHPSVRQTNELIDCLQQRDIDLDGPKVEHLVLSANAPSELTWKDVEERELRLTKLHLRDAEVILTPNQYKQYASFMERRNDTMLFSAAIAREFFRPKEKPDVSVPVGPE